MARRDTRGFAAPIAVGVVIALALLVALLLEAALAELRAGSAGLAEVRAAARTESALELGIAQRFDTLVRRQASGFLMFERIDRSGADSIVTRVRLIQRGLALVTATSTSRRSTVRFSAGRAAYASIVPDSAVPGELVLRPIRGPWWVAVP